MSHPVFELSPRIEILPIAHGSGDMAQEVRERMIAGRFDCLAVPLPPSVAALVEDGIEELPRVSLVVLPEPPSEEGEAAASFIPVDPCQAVIMGIRAAMAEGTDRAYIDREVTMWEPASIATPDPYALKRVSLAAYAAALVPALPAPAADSPQRRRVAWMAFRLHELELHYDAILCLCPLADWPWLRDAYRERAPYEPPEALSGRPTRHPVSAGTLYFVLGELPFITELYERRRADLRSDRHLSVDGIKELLLETRAAWLAGDEGKSDTLRNWVTPHLLGLYLQYVRNLALLDRRLTPDLYSLVLAAKQMAGDSFAIALIETAKRYAFQNEDWQAPISAGVHQLELPDGEVVAAKNRLQGPPLVWRSIGLKPKPTRQRSRRWAQQWNPFRQCSWPPEDSRIESFTSHVREQAKAILGTDLARVEKFTSSVKDGIDLRESLRHWHGRRARPGDRLGTVRPQIYVREIPPARGNVEAVVFLFDTPADPAEYSWQATWYAEHDQESTLCFYATPFQEQVIGPGIAQSRYGGALFLFPPRIIPNIWDDPMLAGARSLEERLIAGAALHSREPHVVLVTPIPPRAAWRRLARDYNRQIVPIPLSRFSGQVIDRLRRFHVLNGHDIRSYASRFIRET